MKGCTSNSNEIQNPIKSKAKRSVDPWSSANHFFPPSGFPIMLSAFIVKQVPNLSASLTIQLILLQLNSWQICFPKTSNFLFLLLLWAIIHEKQEHTPGFPYYCSFKLPKRLSFSPQTPGIVKFILHCKFDFDLLLFFHM